MDTQGSEATPQAGRAIAKADPRCTSLETMPDCQNVKSLANHEYGYRLRIGNYRVLFDWFSEIRIVEIQEVRKRNERTY
jgi:mRNA-degrading endonuclease RelE of RelBE toxin-antitoxin system